MGTRNNTSQDTSHAAFGDESDRLPSSDLSLCTQELKEKRRTTIAPYTTMTFIARVGGLMRRISRRHATATQRNIIPLAREPCTETDACLLSRNVCRCKGGAIGLFPWGPQNGCHCPNLEADIDFGMLAGNLERQGYRWQWDAHVGNETALRATFELSQSIRSGYVTHFCILSGNHIPLTCRTRCGCKRVCSLAVDFFRQKLGWRSQFERKAQTNEFTIPNVSSDEGLLDIRV